MIGIEFRFLAGRYHANGWNHAHNEGVPEWPPSPWRIMRALVNAAYAEDMPIDQVAGILEKLRTLPRYRLPLAVDAHCRHYMPDTNDAGHKRAKVFDTFVAIDGGARDPQPVTVAWQADLEAEERSVLSRLCRRIPYLGRAESWTEARVVEPSGDAWDCWPDEQAVAAESTALVSVVPDEELGAWAKGQAKPKKGRDVPRSLWDVLTFDGERFRSEGWSSVPGTRLARYVFNRPPFRRSTVPLPHRRPTARPTVARFAIRSAVLPKVEEALRLGEQFRKAMMSRSANDEREVPLVFSGHGSSPSNHQHAMYLSTSYERENAHRGIVDSFLIVARSGFQPEEVLALQRVRRLWRRNGHALDLVLVGLGDGEDYGGLTFPKVPALAQSKVWRTFTPFVPTRHTKMKGGIEVDGIEEQIRRACLQMLGVAPVRVEPIDRPQEWARFHRRRAHGGGRRGVDAAFGARLVFDQPVAGPIALGYGAHFGLGLFVAEPPSTLPQIP